MNTESVNKTKPDSNDTIVKEVQKKSPCSNFLQCKKMELKKGCKINDFFCVCVKNNGALTPDNH